MSDLPASFERVTVRFPPAAGWHVWVLSDHYERQASAGPRGRTYLGELVYRAKYCREGLALHEFSIALRHSVLQLREFGAAIDGFAAVTVVAAVPCDPPKPLSLPHAMASVVANTLQVPDLSPQVVKTKQTPPAKTRAELHPDAYDVTRPLTGHCVLLVDDLYHTGATLESVAIRVRAAGARHVVGLCATKAHKGMTL